MAVRVRPAREDAVLLDNPEPGRGLACACERAIPAVGAERLDKRGRLACDAGAAGEDVEGYALAEQDLADGAADGCDVGFLGGGEGGAFGVVPFDSGGVLLLATVK